MFLIPGPIIEELNLELKDLERNLELKDLELDEDDGDVKSDPYEEMEAKAQEVALSRRFRLLGKQAPPGWYICAPSGWT